MRLQDKILTLVGLERSGRTSAKDIAAAPLKPSELSSLIKAWDTLEDRKRVLRNVGLPKPIEAGKGKKFPRAPKSFEE